MSTADFQKVLVKDDRIGNITDSIKYAVMKGGQSVTSAQFQAISQSTSSHTYNIQVPSQETLIDRHLVWKSTPSIQITLANNSGAAVSYANLIGYGGSGAAVGAITACSSLSAFPLHQMCSVMTATINNTSVSINIRDVLPFILRFNDKRELSKYNSTTPTAFDTYQKYSDAIGTVNNPLGSWGNSADNDLVPRGAFPVQFFAADGITPLVMSATVANGASANVVVKFTSAEPLLLSPFMFCDPKYSNQALYGVQNLNFVFNIGDLTRVWRTSLQVYPTGTLVAGVTGIGMIGAPVFFGSGFTDSQLHFQFLTPHPSDLLPSRNVCPYYELPRYITGQLPLINNLSSTDVTSQTLQLNQIPDKLVIAVRKRLADQTNQDTDSFLPINNVSIQFNNQAGILSSATKYDLFDMCVKNGSNQTWYEFNGEAYSASATGTTGNVHTSGSILMLEFGRDIQLPEDFYASGSLGNFNIQCKVNVTNNTGVNINGSGQPQYEIVLITMNSGVFVCERGTSQVYTGILTKQDVLEASSQEAYTRSDVARLVGGGFFDTLKSIAGKVKDVIGPVASALGPVAKMALSAVPDPRAQLASKAIGALGYGQSGGKKMDARLM